MSMRFFVYVGFGGLKDFEKEIKEILSKKYSTWSGFQRHTSMEPLKGHGQIKNNICKKTKKLCKHEQAE